jgi:hypothetical protein
MPDQASDIVAAYKEKTPGSAQLYTEALGKFPSGITHDIRRQDPHPLYLERAGGAPKRDVDGTNMWIISWATGRSFSATGIRELPKPPNNSCAPAPILVVAMPKRLPGPV